MFTNRRETTSLYINNYAVPNKDNIFKYKTTACLCVKRNPEKNWIIQKGSGFLSSYYEAQ